MSDEVRAPNVTKRYFQTYIRAAWLREKVEGMRGKSFTPRRAMDELLALIDEAEGGEK